MRLNFVHLFPQKMNIYGDWGNVEVIKRRSKDMNLEFVYKEINNKNDMDIVKKGDLFFCGGGQDSDQRDVWNIIEPNKSMFRELFLDRIQKKKVFLLICGGYQMFGKVFLDSSGNEIPGLDILPIKTTSPGSGMRLRCVGDLIVKTDLPIIPNTLVGFENHGGQTYFLRDLDHVISPLGKVLHGFGNNMSSCYEGCRYQNIFGSYMHGPILPKNIHFADYLIRLALSNTGDDKEIAVSHMTEGIEMDAHLKLIEDVLRK
jgi:lipid II isoglutaminyl synthase (glutamine-hydrolysing)